MNELALVCLRRGSGRVQHGPGRSECATAKIAGSAIIGGFVCIWDGSGGLADCNAVRAVEWSYLEQGSPGALVVVVGRPAQYRGDHGWFDAGTKDGIGAVYLDHGNVLSHLLGVAGSPGMGWF